MADAFGSKPPDHTGHFARWGGPAVPEAAPAALSELTTAVADEAIGGMTLVRRLSCSPGKSTGLTTVAAFADDLVDGVCTPGRRYQALGRFGSHHDPQAEDHRGGQQDGVTNRAACARDDPQYDLRVVWRPVTARRIRHRRQDAEVTRTAGRNPGDDRSRSYDYAGGRAKSRGIHQRPEHIDDRRAHQGAPVPREGGASPAAPRMAAPMDHSVFSHCSLTVLSLLFRCCPASGVSAGNGVGRVDFTPRGRANPH
ncbi:hypothetical protein GCM10020216_044620 [Nonomuraea helvata]